jgi:hypothetical protein
MHLTQGCEFGACNCTTPRMTASGQFETKSDAFSRPSIGLVPLQELTFPPCPISAPRLRERSRRRTAQKSMPRNTRGCGDLPDEIRRARAPTAPSWGIVRAVQQGLNAGVTERNRLAWRLGNCSPNRTADLCTVQPPRHLAESAAETRLCPQRRNRDRASLRRTTFRARSMMRVSYSWPISRNSRKTVTGNALPMASAKRRASTRSPCAS